MAKPKTAAPIDLRHYDIIVKPVITEKSTLVSEFNQVVFKVANDATKPQVKAAEGKLVVVEDFALGNAKTKLLIERLAGLGVTNGLFVDGDAVDASFAMACANLYKIDVMPAVGANVYDILNHDMLVLTRAAVAKLEARVNG